MCHKSRMREQSGFTLIEVVLVIVITGILVAVTFKTGRQVYDTAKVAETKHELNALADAIAGNPVLVNNGIRSDFGYVGDIGSLPPDLDALYSNPGSYATWNGPYISNRFTQVANDYKKDAWGTDYAYGGTTITSSGSGSNMNRRIANSSDELLRNSLSGSVFDADGTPPGRDYRDSIAVFLTVPNGSGGQMIRAASTDLGGYFVFDSLPIGAHDIEIVYGPQDDTLRRFVAVNPGSETHVEFRFEADYWYDIPSGLTTGLAAHWKLDEATGMTAADFSGNGNDGTLTDMGGTEWTTGKIGGALEFNGTDDHVRVPHSDELNGSSSLTYAAWVFPHTWNGTRQVIAKSVHGGGSGRAQMGIFSEGGMLYVRAETLSGRINLGTALPPLDTWTHVAAVFDGSILGLYIDGVEANSSAFSATTLVQTTDGLNISKRVGTAQYFFDGLLDDIRVYSRALEDTEVQDLFNMGS